MSLSLAIPAPVENMNPIAKAKAAASIFGDLKDGKKDTTAPSGGQPSGTGVLSGNNQPAPPTPQPADPALAYGQKDLYSHTLLKPIIQAADGNVDWAGATPSGDKAGTGLSFIESMLDQSKTDLDKQTSNGIMTTRYKQILEEVTKVSTLSIKTIK